MRIAVDIQALQTVGSKDRGVGRYTRSLFRSILRIDPHNEYVFIANANLGAPKIEGLSPHRLISMEYPDDHRQASEAIMKVGLLAGGFDVFHVAVQPLEVFDALIPPLDASCHLKVVWNLYDIIPFLYPNPYLLDTRVKEAYLARLSLMARSDHVFAISECTRQDFIRHLNVPAGRVTNVGTGVDEVFSPLPSENRDEWHRRLRSKFAIDHDFIFYVGGGDLRKNIAGLIRAYSRLPHSLLAQHQLVIGGKLAREETQHYSQFARECGLRERVIFTDFLHDEELVALYSLCQLFVFPSEYEGFGLPLAEAMACGAPVIATDSSSLPEVVGEAGVLVATGSEEQLTEAMSRVLTDEQLGVEMSRRSLEQARKFSWDHVARKVLDVYGRLGQGDRYSFDFKRIPGPSAERPRIALFSPLNPVKSGISDYTEELLPYLAERFQVDLYLDSGYSPSSDFVLEHCRWYEHSAFEQRIEEESYLAVWYQLGNSSYHAYMIGYILKYGGIITMHDYGLGGLVHWLSCELPDSSPNRLDLYEELVYGYGKAQANAILERMQQGKLWPHEFASENIFLNKRFFVRSIGMIVHSHWAYEMARRDFPGYPDGCLRRIPQGIPTMPKPTTREMHTVREQLGIPEDALVVAAFGGINVPKLPASCIKGFAELAREEERALLLFVGECQPGYTEPVELIRESGLADRVRITGYVDFESFYDYMKACDIVLNLRYPTLGETSGSLLRALSLGRPTIVGNAGAFTDFPDDVVMKVAYAPDCSEDVAQKLLLLARDARLRNRMGRNARSYISKHHSMTAVSRDYIEFMLECTRNRSAQIKLIADYAGKLLSRAGVPSSDERTLDLASLAIARVL